MRHGDNDLSRLYSDRHEHKSQRVCAAVHADTELCPAKRGELLFEFLHHRPADDPRIAERFLDHSKKLLLQFLMRRVQIQKRYFCRIRHGYFFSSFANLKNFAGFPATIAFAGTSFATTLPAPTIAFSPIVTLHRMVAPEPIEAPLQTLVFSTFQSDSVCRPPPATVARGYTSLINVTLCPMNTPSSMSTPSH